VCDKVCIYIAGATVCTSCDAGKYKAMSGVNTGCDNCEAGKYKANVGVNLACDNCEAGKYKATSGVNTACDNCEAASTGQRRVSTQSAITARPASTKPLEA